MISNNNHIFAKVLSLSTKLLMRIRTVLLSCSLLGICISLSAQVPTSSQNYPLEVSPLVDDLSYTYDGTKLRVTHIPHTRSNTRTDYCENITYENGTAIRAQFDGGYATLPDGNLHYYVKDHLGSNRLVVSSSGQIEERNDYYPYGGLFSGSSSLQPYKYNGKELDDRLGLSLYDYGARFFDSALGKWDEVDSESESAYNISPYIFCQDKPINLIDPDGRFPWMKVVKTFGKALKTVGKEGLQSFGKAFDAASLFSDIIDDYIVITDERAIGADRVIAGISLASNVLSPVSLGDIKDISTISKKIVHGNSKLSTKAQHAYDIMNKRTGKRIKNRRQQWAYTERRKILQGRIAS